MNKAFFVTGIGTSVGKTICSAALVKLWDAAYWKPIQSGDLDHSDSMMINRLLSSEAQIHQPTFELKNPFSPHYSAELDHLHISLSEFSKPKGVGDKTLIIEGAGGLFVPLNDQDFIIDLIEYLQTPVILVCQDYLGCINHSLLSMFALKQKGIDFPYLVFNGEFMESSKRILLANKPSETQVIEIPWLEKLDAHNLSKAVEGIKIKKY